MCHQADSMEAILLCASPCGPGLISSLQCFSACMQYARLADESTLFVCPDRTLMRIAQMTPQTFNSLQVCLKAYHEGEASPNSCWSGFENIMLSVLSKRGGAEPADSYMLGMWSPAASSRGPKCRGHSRPGQPRARGLRRPTVTIGDRG